jgi:hypothetical protein
MPGMKVTVSTAMRVRDVSRPSPQQEDDARAKVAEWPASRARPTPAPPSARGRKGGAATPRPWRPGRDRGETPTPRTGGGPRNGQGRPTPLTPGQRPMPVPPGAAQRPPQEAAPAPQRPPALSPRHETNEPGPGAARGKRIRRRRRRGQAGG